MKKKSFIKELWCHGKRGFLLTVIFSALFGMTMSVQLIIVKCNIQRLITWFHVVLYLGHKEGNGYKNEKNMHIKNWTFSSPGIDNEIKVDLPHDYVIRQPRNVNSVGGPQNGFYGAGWGIYSKYVKFGNDAHYILDIDGAYACARIYVNNNLVDVHPHGYTPYLIDLTEKIQHGIHNLIRITTQNI